MQTTKQTQICAEIISEFSTIKTSQEIELFFNALINKLDLNFHPDDPFNDYVDESGNPTFTEGESEALTNILEQCFEVPDIDIYEIGMTILFNRLKIEQ